MSLAAFEQRIVPLPPTWFSVSESALASESAARLSLLLWCNAVGATWR